MWVYHQLAHSLIYCPQKLRFVILNKMMADDYAILTSHEIALDFSWMILWWEMKRLHCLCGILGTFSSPGVYIYGKYVNIQCSWWCPHSLSFSILLFFSLDSFLVCETSRLCFLYHSHFSLCFIFLISGHIKWLKIDIDAGCIS